MNSAQPGRSSVAGDERRWADAPHVLLAVSLLTLLAALAAIVVDSGSAWPWLHVVHESGTRTLLGTVFYFDHALREIPLDILLGAGIGVAVYAVSRDLGPPRPLVVTAYAWGLAVTVVVIAAGAILTVGWGDFTLNLAQAPLRVGSPEAWGLHWQYHVVSRLALLLLVLPFAVVASGYPADLSLSGAARPAWLVFASFVGGTLLFIPSSRSVVDPVFIGHQAREFATHAAVTLPLGTAVACWTRQLRSSSLPLGVRALVADPVVRWLAVAGLAFGGALMLGAILTGAGSRGQTDCVTSLVWVHFFEHVLTYLVVALAAAALSGWLASPRRPRRKREAENA